MTFIYIILISLFWAAFLILAAAFVCFYIIFYSPKRKARPDGEIKIPKGEIYEIHRPRLEEWVKDYRQTPHSDVEIKSFDGLTLRGKHYEKTKGGIIELMLHGYRGNAERDMSGGLARAFALGHNALIVDHRAAGRSDGHVISFGVNESRDALAWIDYIIREIDPKAKIIIAGISMGASTAVITAGKTLPKNVVAVLADCGYTSAEEIIKKVIRGMKLPANILYPFATLGARIFGGFDLKEASALEAAKKSTVPIIFFHGDTDTFVPSFMSEENFNACSTTKKLIIIKGAGHALAFPVDEERYLGEAKEFFEENIIL